MNLVEAKKKRDKEFLKEFIKELESFFEKHEVINVDCFIYHDGDKFSTRGTSVGLSRHELAGRYLECSIKTLFDELERGG